MFSIVQGHTRPSADTKLFSIQEKLFKVSLLKTEVQQMMIP